MMDDAFQPRCPARPFWKHRCIEAFSKYSSAAMRCLADKAASQNAKVNPSARAGQITHLPDIVAVNATETCTANTMPRESRPVPSHQSFPQYG